MSCCDEPQNHEYGKYNPKKDKSRASAKGAYKLFVYKNPIPEQLKDPDDLKELFVKYKLVPFAGLDNGTGHKLLDFFRYLRTYSDTHGACIESKLEYSFGGKAKIVYDSDDFFEFKQEEKEVPLNIAQNFAAYARTINWDNSTIRQFVENAMDPWLWSGNYYVELVHTQTAGIWKTSAYVHQPEHCLYLLTEEEEQRYIAISIKWDQDYLLRHKPRVVPVFPAYSFEDGSYRTLIHEMHGNYPWYGRMSAMSGILPIYNEIQISNFMVKHADANFMAQVFIELEDGDGEVDNLMDDKEAMNAGFENAMDRFEQNYTAKGDNPSAMMVTSRPHGAKNAFVHEFSPKTNENYYEKVSDINSKKIIKAHNWSKRLMGDDVANGLSTNVFLDEFSIKNVTTIRKLQLLGNWLVNTVITEAMKFSGTKGLEGIRIALTSPFEEMLVQESEIEETAKTESSDGGQ